MPFIVINDDKDSKEQMRSNMREHMRNNYRGGGSYRGGMNYRGGNYRTEEAYKEGYEHGYRDGADDMDEEHYRRSRDSRGRFT